MQCHLSYKRNRKRKKQKEKYFFHSDLMDFNSKKVNFVREQRRTGVYKSLVSYFRTIVYIIFNINIGY